MIKKCYCNDWLESSQVLFDQQIFCANQSAAPKWEGKVFDYCPWCGQRLLVCEKGKLKVVQPDGG